MSEKNLETIAEGKDQMKRDLNNSTQPLPFSVIHCNNCNKRVKTALTEKVVELHRMATVVSDSNDAVILHDPNGKILAWNRGAKETYGYTQEEALEKNVRDLVAELDREAALTLIGKIMQGEIVKSFELRRITKDGRILDVWLTTTLLRDENGKPVAIATTERDITERKRAELELIAAKEKAEESDRLKSAFLANMSHEIRTPLNSIIGFSELMSDPDFDREQKNQFAQIIQSSGNNLLSIINDIMDISKIEAGQMEVKNRLFSVNQLMSDIQKEYSFRAIEKGIKLILAPSNPLEVVSIESDQTKLRQILVNLVGNSIKFTEEGYIELGLRITQEALVFHVKDTGIGISTEFQTQIFERFRQVESPYTRKYGGNGLGLPISKSLIELLGGTIWMESAIDKGSVFYFTIPIKKAL